MPLNIQDQEGKQPASPTPPLTPGEDGSPRSSRSLLLVIFAIVVIASVFFLLIQFGVIPTGAERDGGTPAGEVREEPAVPTAEPGPQAPVATPPRAAAPEVASPDAGSEKTDVDRAAELRKRLGRVGGEYTIFISAFSAAADAEELAGRWDRAGYETVVRQVGSWHRVGIGRFSDVASARQEAEKLRQALEEGYWIGRADQGE